MLKALSTGSMNLMELLLNILAYIGSMQHHHQRWCFGRKPTKRLCTGWLVFNTLAYGKNTSALLYKSGLWYIGQSLCSHTPLLCISKEPDNSLYSATTYSFNRIHKLIPDRART